MLKSVASTETVRSIVERQTLPLLAFAVALTGALCIYLGRGGFFTTDELTQVALVSQSLSLESLLVPTWGHLLLLPRLVYWAVLESLGGSYIVFQILGLTANTAVVFLLLAYLKRFASPLFALAACLVLLLFGVERLDAVSGNAFMVKSAVAFGLGAVLLTWRSRARWDVVACLLLTLGISSFSTALVFVIYIVAWLIYRRDYTRIWIALVPLSLYVVWRIYLNVGDLGTGIVDIGAEGIELKHILLWPVWSLNALGAILSSVTGLTYLFDSTELPRTGSQAWGSVLVVGFLILLWKGVRRSLSPELIAGLTALALLFLLQTLSWIPEIRGPDASRYQYVGAVLLFMVLASALALLPKYRELRLGILALLVCGMCVNTVLLVEGGAVFRKESLERRADVTAAIIASQSVGGQPDQFVMSDATIDPANLAVMDTAEARYGDFYTPVGSHSGSEFKARVNSALSEFLGLSIEAATASSYARCEIVWEGEGREFPLNEQGLTMTAVAPAQLMIRRYGSGPEYQLGMLEAGNTVQVVSSGKEVEGWKGTVRGAGVRVCQLSGNDKSLPTER